MWNTDQFDHQGGFSTPQAEDKKKGSKRSSSIVPVTVAQILTAKHEDDVFVSGNLELSMITLVGLITSVNESPTRIDYMIDDMTGPPIEVRFFNTADDNENPDSKESTTHPTNIYVRISGNLRAFGGKRTVNAIKITPLTDMNELTYHILDVIHANGSSEQISGSSQAGNKQPTMGKMDTGRETQIPGLTTIQAQIQMIIKNKTLENGDNGCSIDEICQQLKSVAPKAIRDAIEFLSGEGHIYSTIDDEHFSSTD
ncbi:replication protein A 32 kDa subunit-like [Physella acuta]|uniref:replication protein A 32 kDa subunit-like n=1 Tax=Physella acuta TaxID=109671 RepID=UPI0027DD6F2F|nr:replication protein A 32 kDa subunit-like [Physella acuta]